MARTDGKVPSEIRQHKKNPRKSRSNGLVDEDETHPYRRVADEMRAVKEEYDDFCEESVKKEADTRKKAAETKKKEYSYIGDSIYICLAVFVAIAAFVIACYLFSDLFNPSSASQDVKFAQRIEDLRREFTKQDRIVWETLKKLGRKHLIDCQSNKGPDRPLVLVLASLIGYERSLGCLLRQIGKAFNHGKAPSVLDGNEMANRAVKKADLDKELSKILENSQESQKLVIVTELASLSYETASIFFKYCDNEGAPYPRAVFIFTLTFNKDKNFLEQRRKQLTADIRSYLRTVAWKDVDYAKTDALIARILDPFPLPVFQEEPSSLEKVCAKPS